MKRQFFPKRVNYPVFLEEIGFNYWNWVSGPNKLPYWQEGVVYGFSETKVDLILDATQELHDMSIEMVGQMVKSGDYPEYFALDKHSIPLIEQSWKRQDKSLYGRFDLVFDGKDRIKMLEYNGDTPVSVLECAVAQWHYVEFLVNEGHLPESCRIQYNMIDENLIELWKSMYPPNTLIHFLASADFRHEDWGNLSYIMDTAFRAGMRVKDMTMQDIGHDRNTGHFVDNELKEMKHVFKLYPWEWMTHEDYGQHIQGSTTQWLEPAWKMLLSNKAMLIKLWEMFPNHPLLLESHSEQGFESILYGQWAKKAIHGREGSNIYKIIREGGINLEEDLAQGSHRVPDYDQWGYMYQKWHNLPIIDNTHPIIGSWVIGNKASGMSIREDANLVTGNDSFFASHFYVPYAEEQRLKHLYE